MRMNIYFKKEKGDFIALLIKELKELLIEIRCD